MNNNKPAQIHTVQSMHDTQHTHRCNSRQIVPIHTDLLSESRFTRSREVGRIARLEKRHVCVATAHIALADGIHPRVVELVPLHSTQLARISDKGVINPFCDLAEISKQ